MPGGTPKPSKILVSTNCHYCPHLDKSGAWWGFTTNQKYIVPSRISCKLNNLVYLFTCTCCGLQYLGETSRSLATRMSEHLHGIRHEANPDQAPPPHLSNKKAPPQWPNILIEPSQLGRSQSTNLRIEPQFCGSGHIPWEKGTLLDPPFKNTPTPGH